MIWLVNGKYLNDYKVLVEFNDNKEMIVDLENHLEGEIFEPLKDMDYFKQVKFNPESETIEWENGADFAPVFLYEIGQVISKTA